MSVVSLAHIWWLVWGIGTGQLRNLLIEAGYFGTDDVAIAIKLKRAHTVFKQWCAANRIECSQPVFTEKMEPGLDTKFYFNFVFLV